MSERAVNTFQDGLNLDIADLMMGPSFLRFAQNVRILNQEGSSYLLTNLQGTEEKFLISSGFTPVAVEEYNNVLYIISKTATQFEIGTYPSVDPANSGDIWKYRPLNNLVGGPTVGDVTNAFRLNLDVLNVSGNIVIQKITIQPDYDRSVNILFTIRGFKPRIVNSKFSATYDVNSSLILSYSATRPGTANSNEYTLSSVEKETSTVLYSTKILKIAYDTISTGGKLKPGNYAYVFHYMTEDFNTTNVVGQSSVCQVAFGDSEFTRKGGDETDETDKRVVLALTNIDTDFKYLKVYCLYSAGQNALTQQYLELTQPMQITGESMSFIHTGYEDVAEVSADTINVDYSTIEGVDASTQVGGFYFFGGIKQRSFDFTQFRIGAASILPTLNLKTLTLGGLPGYADPANVYNYMGHFGGETYPWGIVFIMPDGTLSPVFPVKGVTMNGAAGPSVTYSYEAAPTGSNWYKGLVKFPGSNFYAPYSSGIKVKGLDFNLSAVPQYVKDSSVGFFFVRGERKTTLITQGLVIPTMKVPVIEDFSTDADSNNTYWQRFKNNIDDYSFFKFMPCLDSLLEAYRRQTRDDDGETGADKNVLDADNKIKDGYMPIFINDLKNMDSFKGGWTSTTNPEVWYSKQAETWARHWAFISGEALVNEPFYVPQLQRDNIGIHQLAKVQFRVQGLLNNLFTADLSTVQTGLWYEFNSFLTYASNALKRAKKAVFVPGETLATGTDFVSRLSATLYFDFISGSPDKEEFYHVHTLLNSYFGLEMEEGSLGQLSDASKGTDNPIGGNNRIGSNLHASKSSGDGAISTNLTSGVKYNNYNSQVYGGFLVNIYSSDAIPTPDTLYPTIDNVVYKQVGPRYTWADVPSTNIITVFGGDCYISKVYRKLNQSGERNPAVREPDNNIRTNIDQGHLVSWWQESKYNLSLRQPATFDVSELTERSFFPYQSRGDYHKYRSYRYPETTVHSQGYSVVTPAKSFYPQPSLAPFLENYYFSRIAHSERHIPNAFRNGFRSFLPSNYKDYDSSLGSITGMFNLRGNLLVVFEHGIGLTSIEQRVPIGGDAAGQVFIQPSVILPSTLSYASREIGSQHNLSLVQTPGAVYGVDVAKNKIWKMSPNGLEVISDNGFSSWLMLNTPVAPRSGYDLQNNEVIFCTNNWTLCFREGLEKFVSFYSLGSAPSLFGRRGSEMYSFVGNKVWVHNSPNTYQIYAEDKDVVVEVVINQNATESKVYDFLHIISNEVPPVKAEWFTYNQRESVSIALNPAGMNQYTKIDYGTDFFTEEVNMKYRDKRYVIQVPNRSIYNSGGAEDNWEVEGRMRDKYMVLRLTYRTSLPLQLASIITNFRYSFS
jgi:hypothetical protein